jgi:predicted NBD/HSP70 family sugar kinase
MAATELQVLAKAHPGKLHVLKLTSADEGDNHAAVEEIKKVAGRLDVVIANAGAMLCSDSVGTRSHAEPGIANWFGDAVAAPLDAMREHYEVPGTPSSRRGTADDAWRAGERPRRARALPGRVPAPEVQHGCAQVRRGLVQLRQRHIRAAAARTQRPVRQRCRHKRPC